MKILLFNGSPKRESSDTMHMTRAFIEGIKSKTDAEVKQITVVDKKIGYCLGCFACKKNGGKCVQDDDMADILQSILESDVLLFSFPLYSYSMPSQLKALIDRTMPLSAMSMVKVGDRYEHPGQADFGHLRYIMVCGCGFPNSKNNFEGIVTQFGFLFGSDATMITVPESPMFSAPEADVVTKPFLEIMRFAGAEYAERGCISDATMAKLKTPMIPEEVYAKICNGEA